MSEVTVQEYADVLKISSRKLLQQLESAGINCEKGLQHVVTDEQKQKLLEKLKSDHGEKDTLPHTGVTQFTVVREEVTELNVKVQGSSSSRPVTVVTKKRRRFIKRAAPPEAENLSADAKSSDHSQATISEFPKEAEVVESLHVQQKESEMVEAIHLEHAQKSLHLNLSLKNLFLNLNRF